MVNREMEPDRGNPVNRFMHMNATRARASTRITKDDEIINARVGRKIHQNSELGQFVVKALHSRVVPRIDWQKDGFDISEKIPKEFRK